jgi:hypothetical protein
MSKAITHMPIQPYNDPFHTTVQVTSIPDCDYCETEGVYYRVLPAYVDGATKKGPWAYMCKMHFVAYGTGLGLGRGQRLILKNQELNKSSGIFGSCN